MWATRSLKDWPEETLVALSTDKWGGGVLVLHDLPSDPSTNPWIGSVPQEKGSSVFEIVWEGGLWGLGRCVSEEVVH